MNKVFLFIFASVCSVTLNAQAPETLWTRTYGGSDYDWGYSVQETSDGGFMVAGSTSSFGAGAEDAWLIRTDASGDTLWTRTYGGSDYDFGKSGQQTSDGGFIMTGYNRSLGGGECDLWLIRINPFGDTRWSWTYGGSGGEAGWSVQQTSDGGFIVAGFTSSIGAGGSDVRLIRTDSLGGTLWARTYGGSLFDVALSVQQTSDGGFIVVGKTESFGAGAEDVWLVRTDASGDTLWTKTYGGIDNDHGWSVQQTLDGGFIVAGGTQSFGAGGGDVWLLRTDAFGDTLWTRTYGGSDNDWGYAVQQTLDGGFIVAGETQSFGAGGGDVWLIRTDASGDTLWTRTYGGSDYDGGLSISVQQTLDSGFIVVGETQSFGAGGSDVWLIRLAPDVVSAEEEVMGVPAKFALLQNYPNPFNQATTMRFALSCPGQVTLEILNFMGQRVAILLDGELLAGHHTAVWEAAAVESGVYFCRLAAGEFSQMRKMVLVR